jgi:predicted Zn-dependent protease with MMP-like domain
MVTGVNVSRGAVSPPISGRTGYRLAMFPSRLLDVDLEALVIDALERLPAPFREQLGSVAIVIEDEASPAELASVGARGLFGLYQGIPRTRLSADAAPAPSKITIFRGPLMRAYRTPDALAMAVAETVYHEIAHHFGISDERLHELRRAGR